MLYITVNIDLTKNIGSEYLRSILDLYNVFSSNNKNLFLVGGSVRDLLLGRQPKDYDFCTDATPEELKTIFEGYGTYKILDTGLKHGTITIHDKVFDFCFEVTTYRVDGNYTDSRHPDSVTFTPSLEEDLKRRDFTINSFAYSVTEHKLIMLDKEYLNDLELGIIRTVGDPVKRYTEDALRMLRCIRFAAQLNFNIETETYKALSKCAPLLSKISKERIRDELTKILLSDNPQMLEVIPINNLEAYMAEFKYPYLFLMLECEHENPWHYTDVFHHTMDVIKRLPKDFNLRWAALLHDVGKPFVKKLKPGTTDHYRYIGHPEESFKIANEVMDILKFSNDQKELIGKFVLYHDYPLSNCSEKKFKQKLVEIGEENFKDFIKLREADALAHKLSLSTNFAIEAIQKVKDRYKLILEQCPPLRIKDLKIKGDDLKELGLSGKDIGDMLNKLLTLVLSNPDMNDKQKLINYVKKEIKK